MELTLAGLFEDVQKKAMESKATNPFTRARDAYNPIWSEVMDKPNAVQQAQVLGTKVGEHYSKCRKPDCYFPKIDPTKWATPTFFIAILEAILREYTDPDAKVIVEWWRSTPEAQVLSDLRYIAFSSSYNCLLANTLALKEQLIDPR